MRALTEIQRSTLEWIRRYVRTHGVAPTRAEICDGMKLKHQSIVDQRLFALQRKSWIELRPGSPRYIRLLDEELPLIVTGTVAAGEPILADDRVKSRIPRAVAEAFRRRPDYFVRVSGTSMDRLGYVTGSVVAVKTQSDADNGDVVVARPRRRGDAQALLPDGRAPGRASSRELEPRTQDHQGGLGEAEVRDLRGRGWGAHRGWVQRSRVANT